MVETEFHGDNSSVLTVSNLIARNRANASYFVRIFSRYLLSHPARFTRPESTGCNYKVQVYYQGIRNLDAFALIFSVLAEVLATCKKGHENH